MRVGGASGLFTAMLAGAGLLVGCAVGPDYKRPPAVTPVAYKEVSDQDQAFWKPGEPRDTLPRGAWWSVYDDPVLDGLERQIDISNQNLKAAEAAYRQSQAVIQQARAAFFPTVTVSGSAQRSGRGGTSTSSASSRSGTSTATGATTTTGTTTTPGSTGTLSSTTSGVGTIVTSSSGRTTNQFSLSLGASWDIDVWGRIRRTVESDIASAQVSAADLASARLSAQATLATDYFELRIEDELKRLLDSEVAAFTQSLQITRNQYSGGVASRADVAQAETQLRSTQAQAINVGVLRAQLEHAIAVLIGQPASDFSIAPTTLVTDVPVIPSGVPSTLLERRPDIAASERQMAVANAQIGVAISAYYPDLTLSGSFGYAGSQIGHLITTPNQFWSFGPQLADTLLDFGARSAAVAQARALFDQDIANYRQVVLTAFQQVEDQLAALRILAQQAVVEDQAVQSAIEAERLILNQYKAGTVPYTSVIVAQTTALSNRQTALTVRESRLVASVALLQALGGGWDASQLPNSDQVEDDPAPAPLPVSLREAPKSP